MLRSRSRLAERRPDRAPSRDVGVEIALHGDPVLGGAEPRCQRNDLRLKAGLLGTDARSVVAHVGRSVALAGIGLRQVTSPAMGYALHRSRSVRVMQP